MREELDVFEGKLIVLNFRHVRHASISICIAHTASPDLATGLELLKFASEFETGM